MPSCATRVTQTQPSYTNIFHCRPAADREEEEEEEAGKRLPLGPISPSRILCAALSPFLSLSLPLSFSLSRSLSLFLSRSRSAGGVSEYLSTRICGCDCGEAATLLAQSATRSVGLKTETAPKATNKVGADGRRGRRKGGRRVSELRQSRQRWSMELNISEAKFKSRKISKVEEILWSGRPSEHSNCYQTSNVTCRA